MSQDIEESKTNPKNSNDLENIQNMKIKNYVNGTPFSELKNFRKSKAYIGS